MAEKEHMEIQQDRAIRLNWVTVNVPTIVMVIGATITGAWGWASIQSRIDQIEQSRDARMQQSDRQFANIDSAIGALGDRVEPLNNVTYRVGVLEGQINETNDRIDRLSESILSSLELIRRDVNGLSTRVEVLSQKIDGIAEPRAENTSFSPLRLAGPD